MLIRKTRNSYSGKSYKHWSIATTYKCQKVRFFYSNWEHYVRLYAALGVYTASNGGVHCGRCFVQVGKEINILKEFSSIFHCMSVSIFLWLNKTQMLNIIYNKFNVFSMGTSIKYVHVFFSHFFNLPTYTRAYFRENIFVNLLFNYHEFSENFMKYRENLVKIHQNFADFLRKYALTYPVSAFLQIYLPTLRVNVLYGRSPRSQSKQ